MTQQGRRWAVFISGRGSNLQVLLDQSGDEPGEVRWVLSSKADAAGLLRARRSGVATTILPKKIDWVDLNTQLRARGMTHIFLLGFMKLIPADFLENWSGRILNVHPSLLPAYPGLDALNKSYQDDASMGVTVHVVTAEMDAGPRLFQGKTLSAGARTRGVRPLEAQWKTSLMEQKLVREGARRWR